MRRRRSHHGALINWDFAERARQLGTEAGHLAERFGDAFGARRSYLRSRARRRQAALPGCNFKRRPSLDQRHRGGDRAERIARQLMEPKFFSGWGGADRGRRGGTLQSNVLPQWFGVAS